MVQSICEEDLAPALTEIGRRNARQRRSFTLGGVAVTAKAVLYMSPEGASEPTELDPAGSYPWTLVDEGSDTSSPSWFLNFTDTLPPAGSRLGLRYEGPLSGTAPPAGACRDHVDCLAVAGRTACLGGTCESVECWESMDCPLGSVCAGNWACQAGCQNDGDCPAEETCEDGTCVKASCRSTLLDCDFGEFCNAVSGECYQSGGYYCSECETKFDCNGGVDGPNWCLNMSGSEPYYCGVDCWAGQECPAGYSCSRIRTAGNVTVGYVCTAPCWEL